MPKKHNTHSCINIYIKIIYNKIHNLWLTLCLKPPKTLYKMQNASTSDSLPDITQRHKLISWFHQYNMFKQDSHLH